MNTNDAITVTDAVPTFAGGQKLLSRYKLDRVLGQGGMGVVWLARDEELDRDVALKFLPAMVVNDRASLTDLKRETRRSLELTHPNIVRTYDFVQDAAIAGISMEYVECDTLRNRRLDQPSGVFEAQHLGDWVRQLCDALDYAHHQAAIVHRDLKPANLMINSRNQLKVADFGISRSLVESMTQVTGSRGVSGTLVYMSPQQLSGESAHPLDDVYAVGATLYELFTTRPPFYTGDIAGQVHTKVPPSMTERRASLGIGGEAIPEDWETTIAACLAKEPGQRPRSAGEIAVRLGLADASSITNPGTSAFAAIAPPPLPVRVGATRPPITVHPVLPPAAAPRQPSRLSSVPKGLAALAAGLILVAGLTIWYAASGGTAARERETQAQAESARRQAAEQQRAEEEKRRLEAERLANARGSIMIKTEPSGATVKVDDSLSQTTPAVFSELKLGKHAVQITRNGYDPVTLSGEVKENQTSDLGSVVLARSKGALRIASTPEGLNYELRSRDNPQNVTRGTTPMPANEMLTGDYDVTVTREGWPTKPQSVTVLKDSEALANFVFAGGDVSITSEPAGAKVTAGGKDLGQTPLELKDQVPGDVEYTITLAGYESAVKKETVAAGEPIAFAVPLQKTVAKKGAPAPAKTRVASSSGSGTKKSNSGGSSPRKRSSGDSEGGGGSNWMRYIPGGGFPVPRPGGFPRPPLPF